MTYNLTRRVVLGIYAVLVIVPLVVVIFGSLKTSQDLFASPFAPPTNWQLDNYTKIVGESGLGVAFRNSVIVTGCSVPLTLFFASLASYGIARIPGWKSGLLFGFFVLGHGGSRSGQHDPAVRAVRDLRTHRLARSG